MSDRNAEHTRARILEIAGELFQAKGYAGTSIADIAGRLGTSKAALYYHFRSKEEILDAILGAELEAHARISELAATGTAEPARLLGAFIDMVSGAGRLLGVFGNDPSVGAVLAGRDELRRQDGQIIAALAGPDADAAATVRAHAALAVVKEGPKEVMAREGGVLTSAAREELLAAALRALSP
jgi:AcrR family transcriptional regulator